MLRALVTLAVLVAATLAADEVLLDDVETDRCTTIVVGPKAGIEGPMTTHTADCANCDFRVAKVHIDHYINISQRGKLLIGTFFD
jgi:hypothetical protein